MNKLKEIYEKNDKKWYIVQRWIMGKLFHIFEKHNIWRETIVLNLIKNFKNKKSFESILDVGCGRWWLLLETMKTLENVNEVYWIDINENRIKDANTLLKKTGKKVDVKFMDINNKVDYADGTMDLVTCVAVLEHVFEPTYLVEEFARIIKKDGVVIIEVPNIVVFFRRIAFLLWVRPRTSWDQGWDGTHLAYFTVRDLRNLLEEKWFIVEKVTGAWVFAGLRNWWVSMLSADIIIQARKK